MHAMRDYEAEAHDAAQPSRARARPAASRVPPPSAEERNYEAEFVSQRTSLSVARIVG